MRTVRTWRAGERGTIKLVRRYGRDLIAVRFREDLGAHERLKTVEIVIERLPLGRSRDGGVLASFRIGPREHLLRRAVLLAGGRWDEQTNLWRLARDRALALGLGSRLRRR